MITRMHGRVVRAVSVAMLAAFSLFVSPCEEAVAQDAGQYTVKAGDTLFSIARTYGVSLDSLRKTNLLTGDVIHVGQVLQIPGQNAPKSVSDTASNEPVRPPVESLVQDSIVVPVAPDVTTAEDRSAVSDSIAVDYVTTSPGESLYDIAFSIGIDIDSLISLNPRVSTFLDTARIAVPSMRALTRYRVRSGDTLYKIAREHESSVEAIRLQNSLATDAIEIGQELLIPSSGARIGASDRGAPMIARGQVRPYPSRFQGRLMASGKVYDEDRYYVSHVDLPFGSIVLLSTGRDGSDVFAEVVDRLPSTADYAMDVSLAVAMILDVGGKSNPDVEIRVVRFGPGR